MNQFEEPPQQGLLSFYAHAIGPKYGLLLALAALVTLVTTLVLLIRGRGPALGPALLLIVPLPIVVASFAVIGGLIDSYTIIAMSPVAPKPSEVAQGFSQAIVTMWGGLCLMFPIGMLAMIGGLVRSMIGDKQS